MTASSKKPATRKTAKKKASKTRVSKAAVSKSAATKTSATKKKVARKKVAGKKTAVKNVSASKIISSDADRMRDVVLAALEDSKGVDVAVLDVRKLTDVTDYMIIATGTSDRHVKSLANNVLEQMHESGWKHLGVEGEDGKDWVLVDFVDVVVHLMRDQSRKRYDLEGLWDKTFIELSSDERAGSAEQVMSQH